MKLSNAILIPFIFLFISGCSPIVLNPKPTQVVKSEISYNIYDSMKQDSVSKQDAEIMYKNYVGLVRYLPHSKKIDSTPKLAQIVKDFQVEYGYERGNYKNFTQAVDKHLTDSGYKKPKKIVQTATTDTEVEISKVVADMKVISDNCEKYLKEVK